MCAAFAKAASEALIIMSGTSLMIIGLEDKKSTKLQRHWLSESMAKLQMVELLKHLNDYTLYTRFLGGLCMGF